MKFIEYKHYLLSDLYRHCCNKSLLTLLRAYFLIPGFKYSFWLRTTWYLKKSKKLIPIYAISRYFLHRTKYKTGIDIPFNTTIGKGLYIGHFGGIFVNNEVVIGNNLNLNHGVTIGTTYGGRTPGTPRIGNDVYIGPGSYIIGGITIGDNVAIGANTVVNKSIPDNGVVVGNAGKIISFRGASEYIINTDY